MCMPLNDICIDLRTSYNENGKKHLHLVDF